MTDLQRLHVGFSLIEVKGHGLHWGPKWDPSLPEVTYTHTSRLTKIVHLASKHAVSPCQHDKCVSLELSGNRSSETMNCNIPRAAIASSSLHILPVILDLQQTPNTPAVGQIHALIVRSPLPLVDLLHIEACHLPNAHLQGLAEDCGSSGDQGGI